MCEKCKVLSMGYISALTQASMLTLSLLAGNVICSADQCRHDSSKLVNMKQECSCMIKGYSKRHQ